MAAAHTNVLSSTPSKTQHADFSSPGLPSMSEILAERIPRPLNQSRAKAKAIPDITAADSTSARILPEKDAPQSLDAKPQITFASNNRVAEKGCVERNEPDCEKVRRKIKPGSTTKSSGNMVNDENRVGSGGKKRIKKPRKADQTKITKAKITKPRSGLNSLKEACTEKFAAVNSRCTIEASIDNQRHTSVIYGETETESIDVVPRKKDWTPVRDTSRVVMNDCSILLSTGSHSPVKPPDGVLLKHLGGYRLEGADQIVGSRPQPPCKSNGQATTKKRKLDVGHPVNMVPKLTDDLADHRHCYSSIQTDCYQKKQIAKEEATDNYRQGDCSVHFRGSSSRIYNPEILFPFPARSESNYMYIGLSTGGEQRRQ